MPYAVTHILIPILIVSIFRDFYLKKNKKTSFPLHYVLIAGLGGVLPDIDIPVSMLLNILGFSNWDIHRTFTHTLLFPIIFFILFLILIPIHSKARICNLTRHKLKLSIIFLILSFGILTHLILDSLVSDLAYFLYPLSSLGFGLHLINYLPIGLQDSFLPTLDGVLLVLWICYLEIKHKISDFI